MEAAVEALKAGAYDFVSKPVDLTKLRDLVQTALKLSEGSETPAPVVKDKQQNSTSIIGNSPPIELLKRTIDKLARSQAPVFIHGESGTGKELVAKQIHELSPRTSNSFVPVNCGAIPESLMESEFFGHKKGSFTGAVEDKVGLFEAANHGTLFLDEVADLPLSMQVKLLRVIQEKAVKAVGGLEEVPTDCRILSATHKNLEEEVAKGNFRQDLFYRLNVIKLDVPSLSKRGDDIMLLAAYFLDQIAERWQLPKAQLSQRSINALTDYSFPGNVRELENILERACTLADGEFIEPEDLQLQQLKPVIKSRTFDAVAPQPEQVRAYSQPQNEREEILHALDQTRWNRTAAAKVLGMTFRQLRYRIKKYELDQAP
jgi:two-component system response regulator PilR (NtrC family)